MKDKFVHILLNTYFFICVSITHCVSKINPAGNPNGSCPYYSTYIRGYQEKNLVLGFGKKIVLGFSRKFYEVFIVLLVFCFFNAFSYEILRTHPD